MERRLVVPELTLDSVSLARVSQTDRRVYFKRQMHPAILWPILETTWHYTALLYIAGKAERIP